MPAVCHGNQRTRSLFANDDNLRCSRDEFWWGPHACLAQYPTAQCLLQLRASQLPMRCESKRESREKPRSLSRMIQRWSAAFGLSILKQTLTPPQNGG